MSLEGTKRHTCTPLEIKPLLSKTLHGPRNPQNPQDLDELTPEHVTKASKVGVLSNKMEIR